MEQTTTHPVDSKAPGVLTELVEMNIVKPVLEWLKPHDFVGVAGTCKLIRSKLPSTYYMNLVNPWPRNPVRDLPHFHQLMKLQTEVAKALAAPLLSVDSDDESISVYDGTDEVVYDDWKEHVFDWSRCKIEENCGVLTQWSKR